MRYFNISDGPDIFLIKDFSPKTLNDVGFDLRRKGTTILKSALPNICHTIWNIDAREGVTARKSEIPNTCHTVWNVDVCKRFALREFITYCVPICFD